MQIEISVINV